MMREEIQVTIKSSTFDRYDTIARACQRAQSACAKLGTPEAKAKEREFRKLRQWAAENFDACIDVL